MRIEPLHLLARDPVAALDPTRYGLSMSTPTSILNVGGILWTKPVNSAITSEPEEWKPSGIYEPLKGDLIRPHRVRVHALQL